MSQPKERKDINIRRERAILAAVHLPESIFDERDPLGELRALSETAGSSVVGELTQNRDRPEAGTFIGKGKLEELKAMCEALEAGVVIFDNLLSPKQIATIEKTVERKVIDRCELILDIFAQRAMTKQAKLAVELAQLEYTYPRLRAMWTHLERIVGVGGIGGVGTRGPGEQQLEIDRRLVQNRKVMLRRELNEIHARKEREVAERNLDFFTVGLVGYTNAGKSTLFNTLTEGGAYADDKVFATLMSRTRELDLGGGISAMLSDTVGFIRDLPHNLVASFKATLEEATRADLLIIVLDVSDPAAEIHYNTVNRTLDELFADAEQRDESRLETWDKPRHAHSHTKKRRSKPGFREPKRILLLNKSDRLRDNSSLLVWQQRFPDAIPFSALPGKPGEPAPTGQEELLERIRIAVVGEVQEVTLRIPMREGKLVDLVEKQAEILEREWENNSAILRVRIGSRLLNQVASGNGVSVEPQGV
ncbi:MAG: GTPase HflX [Phycisphaerales bacterium]